MPEHVEHLWTVLCQNVTQDGGALTLSRLIDMVLVPDLPSEPALVPMAFSIASQWRRNLEPGCTLSERILLEHPDGTRVPLTAPTTIDLNTRHLACMVSRIEGIPLRGPGQYRFVVQRRDREDAPWFDAAPTAGLWVPRPDQWPPPTGK